jgi:hypothetical protein
MDGHVLAGAGAARGLSTGGDWPGPCRAAAASGRVRGCLSDAGAAASGPRRAPPTPGRARRARCRGASGCEGAGRRGAARMTGAAGRLGAAPSAEGGARPRSLQPRAWDAADAPTAPVPPRARPPSPALDAQPLQDLVPQRCEDEGVLLRRLHQALALAAQRAHERGHAEGGEHLPVGVWWRRGGGVGGGPSRRSAQQYQRQWCQARWPREASAAPRHSAAAPTAKPAGPSPSSGGALAPPQPQPQLQPQPSPGVRARTWSGRTVPKGASCSACRRWRSMSVAMNAPAGHAPSAASVPQQHWTGGSAARRVERRRREGLPPRPQGCDAPRATRRWAAKAAAAPGAVAGQGLARHEARPA